MDVLYSGWSEKRGSFSCNVFVDEQKTDYEIHFKSGLIAYQSSPFQNETHDWNHDDDVYTQFGAWFEFRNEDGHFQGSQFWTPVDMVSELAEALNPDSRVYGDSVVAIPGIKIPPLEKRPTLEDQILRSERLAMAQDVERNQKMKSLGIRHPDEPWAR
jgi:hypothetical protein